MMTPTAEQQAITDAHRTGANLATEVRASTGQTTTLKMLGAANHVARSPNCQCMTHIVSLILAPELV